MTTDTVTVTLGYREAQYVADVVYKDRIAHTYTPDVEAMRERAYRAVRSAVDATMPPVTYLETDPDVFGACVLDDADRRWTRQKPTGEDAWAWRCENGSTAAWPQVRAVTLIWSGVPS